MREGPSQVTGPSRPSALSLRAVPAGGRCAISSGCVSRLRARSAPPGDRRESRLSREATGAPSAGLASMRFRTDLSPALRATAAAVPDFGPSVPLAVGHSCTVRNRRAGQPPESGRVPSAPQHHPPRRDEQLTIGGAQELADEVGHQKLTGAGKRADACGEVHAQPEGHAVGVEQRFADMDSDAHIGATEVVSTPVRGAQLRLDGTRRCDRPGRRGEERERSIASGVRLPASACGDVAEHHLLQAGVKYECG
jgi:hypothetical protein